MLKKQIKKVSAILLALTFIGGSVFAGTNTNNTVNDEIWKVPTFAVTDKGLSNNSWSNSTTISPNELLSFDLHYFFNNENAGENVKFLMSNLNGKTYNKNQTITVNGTVSSTTRTNKSGSTTVNFTDKVKLELYNVSWQKWPCQSVGCETSLPDSYGKVLTSGLNIGTVTGSDSHYAGNIIVSFKVTKVEETPTYNNCSVNGTTVNHGVSRTFFSSTSVNYGSTCSSIDQTRTCTDGTMSGNSSYKYTSCSVDSRDQEATIDTKNETHVSETCATLNGYVDLNDEDEEYVRFRYGTSSSNLNNTVNFGTKTSNGNFSKRICGLDSDTRYYFQAYSNSDEGDIENFRTKDDSNEETGDVDTNRATSINEHSARLNGDTDGTDVQDKWFAFSRTDSTPSCTSSSQRVNADGNNDFYIYKNNLTCDTTYYYRACGENGDGETISSIVREFRTNQCSVELVDAQVYTNNATNISTNSARLNGYVDINDTENGRVYFVYGTSSTNLNRTTGESSIISDNTSFQSIVGLLPNTRYYYQAVIKDNNGTVDRGVIRSFVTDSNGVTVNPINAKCGSVKETCVRGTWSHVKDSSTQYKWRCNGIDTGASYNCTLNKVFRPTTPTRPTTTRPVTRPAVVSTPRPIEVVVVNEVTKTTEVTKNYEKQGLEINKTVSIEKFGTYGLATAAKIGDKVYYKIRIKNNSNKTIDNVEVKDFIPAELDMNGNSTTNVDKYATYIINLNPGQSKIVLTEMILNNTNVGDVIDSAAKITMDNITENTNSVSISVISDNNLNKNIDDNNNQAASIFGANSSFFPSTILGWMLLLILVLSVGLLFTKILTVNSNNRN